METQLHAIPHCHQVHIERGDSLDEALIFKLALKYAAYRTGIVAHTYSPSYLGGGDRRITVQGQSGQMLMKPYLKNKPGMVVRACIPRYVGDGG